MTNEDEMVRVIIILKRGGDMTMDVRASGHVSPPSINTIVAGMAARVMHGFASDDLVTVQRKELGHD
jgi:hypothetical protein